MSEEKVKKTSVVRRTKKNANRAQNRDLRQSIHEICDQVNDVKVEETERKKTTHKLQRTNSLRRGDTQVSVEPKNSREILKQYVANTHNIDMKTLEKTDRCQNTCDFPIHEAIESENIKNLALYLIGNDNVQIEQNNSYGQTPLMFAVCIGDVEAVNLLITFGSCVNICDHSGVTALRYAVEAGDFEIASILISHGANAETVQNGF